MNKLKVNINKEKKIITVDVLGDINKDNVSSYITQLNTQIERLIQIQQVNISELRFNIYTCHMIINKEDRFTCRKNSIDKWFGDNIPVIK